jgi:hypothetical protein
MWFTTCLRHVHLGDDDAGRTPLFWEGVCANEFGFDLGRCIINNCTGRHLFGRFALQILTVGVRWH